MAENTTPVLLVTANVGSIFEDSYTKPLRVTTPMPGNGSDQSFLVKTKYPGSTALHQICLYCPNYWYLPCSPSVMLKIWTEEFLSTVARLDPKFIALHCQEVGGKNYERSMKHVEDFVRLFMSSEELRLFDKVRVFLDEDYSSAENFTALGNFYFIHESLSDVLIWNFSSMAFESAKGKEIHSGNIEAVTTKEKSKFPQDFFPECKWSRKGFLRTRWNLNGTVFDLINIHLFHDASNFVAMENFPSVYCKNRQRALEHTLERFHNDNYESVPFFVFGDFNFRTDTQGVVNKLADGLNPVRVQSNKNNDHTKLQYRNDSSQIVLSLGKKEFSHTDHQGVFLEKNGQWLKDFDRELEPFCGRLFEFSITFPPSYPFEEDEKGGNNYMRTRCPSWCDRVILSTTARNLVSNLSEPGSVEYGLMGPNMCMGDHKPVYLKMDLKKNAGTVQCCTNRDASSPNGDCVLRFGNLNVCAFCTPGTWSCSSTSMKQTMANIFVTEASSLPKLTLSLDSSVSSDVANRFLAPPHASLLHEPYTPESMETPSSSPIPVRIQRDFGEIYFNDIQYNSCEDTEPHFINFNEENVSSGESTCLTTLVHTRPVCSYDRTYRTSECDSDLQLTEDNPDVSPSHCSDLNFNNVSISKCAHANVHILKNDRQFFSKPKACEFKSDLEERYVGNAVPVSRTDINVPKAAEGHGGEDLDSNFSQGTVAKYNASSQADLASATYTDANLKTVPTLSVTSHSFEDDCTRSDMLPCTMHLVRSKVVSTLPNEESDFDNTVMKSMTSSGRKTSYNVIKMPSTCSDAQPKKTKESKELLNEKPDSFSANTGQTTGKEICEAAVLSRKERSFSYQVTTPLEVSEGVLRVSSYQTTSILENNREDSTNRIHLERNFIHCSNLKIYPEETNEHTKCVEQEEFVPEANKRKNTTHTHAETEGDSHLKLNKSRKSDLSLNSQDILSYQNSSQSGKNKDCLTNSIKSESKEKTTKCCSIV